MVAENLKQVKHTSPQCLKTVSDYSNTLKCGEPWYCFECVKFLQSQNTQLVEALEAMDKAFTVVLNMEQEKAVALCDEALAAAKVGV